MPNFLSQAMGLPSMPGALYAGQRFTPFPEHDGFSMPGMDRWDLPTGPQAPDGPQTDPNQYSFNVQPTARKKSMASGHALLALSAGMLSGDNFWHGLGKGIDAYSNVLEDEDKERRPKIEQLANGAVTAVTDPVTGQITYHKTPVQDYNLAMADRITGRQVGLQTMKGDQAGDRANDANQTRLDIAAQASKDREEERRQRAADRAADRASREQMHADTLIAAGMKGPQAQARARKDVAMEFEAEDAARQAPSDLDTYDRIEQLAGKAGLGQGLGNKLLRGAVSATGVGMGGVDPDALSQLKTELGSLQIQAGQMLKGQGQVSDAERRMLSSSIPNMESSPTALKQVLKVLRSAKQRQINNWNGFRSSGSDSYADYVGNNVPSSYGNNHVPQPRSQPTPSGGQSTAGVKWRIIK